MARKCFGNWYLKKGRETLLCFAFRKFTEWERGEHVWNRKCLFGLTNGEFYTLWKSFSSYFCNPKRRPFNSPKNFYNSIILCSHVSLFISEQFMWFPFYFFFCISISSQSLLFYPHFTHSCIIVINTLWKSFFSFSSSVISSLSMK